MASQIRLRIEYLIPTDNILLILKHSHLIKKFNLIDGFAMQLMIIQKWLAFYWATLYRSRQ